MNTTARSLKILIIALASLGFVMGLGAQNAADNAAPKTFKLLFYPPQNLGLDTSDDAKKASADVAEILANQLGTWLGAQNIDFELPPSTQAVTDAYPDIDPVVGAPFKFAVEHKAQCLLLVDYLIEGKRVTVLVRAFDAWSGRNIASLSRNGSKDITLTNMLNDEMDEVFSSVTPLIPELIASFGTEVEGPESKTLVVNSKDVGAIVEIPNKGPIGMISAWEQLKLDYRPFARGKSVTLRLSKEGYYSKEQTFTIDSVTPELTFPPLTKKTGFEFNLLYYPQESISIGVGARFYLDPDQVFLRLTWIGELIRMEYGDQTHPVKLTDVGIVFPNMPSITRPTVFTQDIDLNLGFFLLGAPDSWIRVWTGIGFGGLLTVLDSGSAFFDTYLDLPIVGVDLSMGIFSFQITSGIKYGFSLDASIPTLFEPGLQSIFQHFVTGVAIRW